jgi:RNA-directed DNA polymerase
LSFNSSADLPSFQLVRIFDYIVIFSSFPTKFFQISNYLSDFLFLRGFSFENESFPFSFNSKSTGFNVKGWKFIINYNNIILGTLDRNNIRHYKRRLKHIIKNSNNNNIFGTLRIVNQEIIFWSNIFSCSDDWSIISRELDLYLYKLFWRFVKKLHPRRSNFWIYSKYWKNIFGVWTLFIYSPLKGDICYLKFHNSWKESLKSYSLPMALNVYDIRDKEKLYLNLFCKNREKFIGFYKFLYTQQKGLCFFCNKPIIFNNFKIANISSYSNFSQLNKNSINYLVLSHSMC